MHKEYLDALRYLANGKFMKKHSPIALGALK